MARYVRGKVLQEQVLCQHSQFDWRVQAPRSFASHETVNHSKEKYVRGDAYTNTLEGYFSIFKRGMKGIYQHCDEQHLQRYLAEFDFRYSNRIALDVDDFERTIQALAGISGKRLTYKKGIDLASQ